MKKAFVVFVTMIVAFIFAPYMMALEPASIKDSLAKTYEGTFKWYGETSTSIVSIKISEVLVASDNSITAVGIGEYKTKEKNTSIDIKIEIKVDSLRFEMWEMNPKPNQNFVTNGSHVGSISENMENIRAIWTTKSTGKQGSLILSKIKKE